MYPNVLNPLISIIGYNSFIALNDRNSNFSLSEISSFNSSGISLYYILNPGGYLLLKLLNLYATKIEPTKLEIMAPLYAYFKLNNPANNPPKRK